MDWLASRTDAVVRFQGGHNAGHTLVVNGKVYKLSLLPSGVVRGVPSLIGNGVVIDPSALLDEIDRVTKDGLTISPANLLIAENACLILPFHATVDRAREAALAGDKLGTTGRGIGPAYEDKVARRALRVGDLRDPATVRERVRAMLVHHNALLRGLGETPIDEAALLDYLATIAPRLLPYATDVGWWLEQARRAGKRILFEGAQGVLLDVDHGTYPYVTSSNTVAGAAAIGSGVGPRSVGYVLGICKAYCTRVGGGPFPTEQANAIGEHLGTRGHEFGTVTGRKRRCGWFDAVALRQAVRLSGLRGLALTKLDVLDGLHELKIATAYDYNGQRLQTLPHSIAGQRDIKPIYETLEGWQTSTRGARSFMDLPAPAIKYVRRIEELVGATVALLSTSPERDDTIVLQDPFVD